MKLEKNDTLNFKINCIQLLTVSSRIENRVQCCNVLLVILSIEKEFKGEF